MPAAGGEAERTRSRIGEASALFTAATGLPDEIVSLVALAIEQYLR
jgi:hypothetical protein